MRHCDFIRRGDVVECRWKCGTRFRLSAAIDERTLLNVCFRAPDLMTCIHRGGKIGDRIKVRCGSGCGGKHQPYICEIHGRCLPTFRGPFGSDYQTEAAIYKLCNICEECDCGRREQQNAKHT